MSSLLKDDSGLMYEKIKVDSELNYEKLAEDSFKAELDETVKLESDKLLSSVKSEEGLLFHSPTPTSSVSSSSVVSTGAGLVVVSSASISDAASLQTSSGTSSSSAGSTSSAPSNDRSFIHKSSSNPSATTASIMSQHGNKRLFKCGFCSSTFADTYKLERHVKSEHRDITDRAKYETFPWQEPGGSSKSSHRSRQNNAPKTLFVDPSQTFNMGHKQQQSHTVAAATAHSSNSNILSKLKMEASPLTTATTTQALAASTSDVVQQSLVSSEYFLCQVCSKIFVSYKDFNLHMNESPACKNGGHDDAFTSNDVLVILSPEDSLKFAGETILDTVVEAPQTHEVLTHHHHHTPTAVYECHLCRALFASADYLKKHLEICQTSNPKRRKT